MTAAMPEPPTSDRLAGAAEAITDDWMLHLGYEPEDIAKAWAQEHADACEFSGEFWQCHDENGDSHHPARDEMDEVAALVMFVLDHKAIANLGARGYRKAVERLRSDAAAAAEEKHHDVVCAGTSWAPCTCSKSMAEWAAAYLEATEGDDRD